MFITMDYKNARTSQPQSFMREVLMIKPNLGVVTMGHGEVIKIKKCKICSTKLCRYFLYKIQIY